MPKKTRPNAESAIDNLPTSLLGFKSSKEFILESLLTPYHFIPQTVEACGIFNGRDLIFRRSQVVDLLSRQSWRAKHMRSAKEGEKPTRIIRKRVGGIERTIELFAMDQTEPLPILVASAQAGIPSNEYGNVEYERIPENAVLVESNNLPLAMRICRTLGFPFSRCQRGWKRRSPNFVGVVVLKEHESAIREALLKESEKQDEIERKSSSEAALSIWKVLLRRIEAEFYIRTKLQ